MLVTQGHDIGYMIKFIKLEAHGEVGMIILLVSAFAGKREELGDQKANVAKMFPLCCNLPLHFVTDS